MTFSVNTRALSGLPPSLDRRTDELTRGTTYLLANVTLHDGSGLANVLGIHERVIANIQAFLTAVSRTYPIPDAARIRACLTAYGDSDTRAAARADATVPGVTPGLSRIQPLSATERALGPSVFDDHLAPAFRLTAPANHYGDIPYQPNWFDLLSPSSIARDAIWKITSALAAAGWLDRPYDPFETLVEPFVGDWAGLLRCAEVFDHLAALLSADATCVLDAGNALDLVWTGNVADRAELNLQAFARQLNSGVAPLGAIATTYRQVAQGVQDNANLIETLVTNLVDDAIDGSLDVATLGLFDIYDIGTKIRDFIKVLLAAVRIAANVADLVSSGFAASNDAVNRLGILQSAPGMPSQPFPVPLIPWPVPYPKPAVPIPGD